MNVAFLRTMILLGKVLLLASPVMGQTGSGAPPAVGVITVQKRPMAESTEINGRIQAPQLVNVVARVTAFMNERLFAEGADVKTGDLLYKLERGPFEADVEAKQGAVAQIQAQLENANLTLARAQELLQKFAGTQVAADSAIAATDQSRLHGNSFPDRWPNRSHVGDDRKRCQPYVRSADDDCEH